MKRLSIVLSIFLICGCLNENQNIKRPTTFKVFEISYENSWNMRKNFSFLVDSNKIYLSPQKSDKIYYGVLPDSIFKLIDHCVLKILKDTTIKSKDDGCVDCSIVAVKIVSSIDTNVITQTGNISKEIAAVIKSVQTFIDRGKHQSIKPANSWSTHSIVHPPSKVGDIRFPRK